MPWTKELVQKHAQTAMAVELYTIPFYTTVMTSIKDTTCDAYSIIRGVLIEEMMHLQLAANLSLALDTIPAFQIPVYDGKPIPLLKPYDPATGTNMFLQAKLGPLDDTRMAMMLAIETPEEIDPHPEKHVTPQYPYSSIGEMYDALFVGIGQVGVDKFSWTTVSQRAQWSSQKYPQLIGNVGDAEQAIKAIKAQGEGCPMGAHVQKPYTPSKFPVPDQYQMINTAPGTEDKPYQDIAYKQYAHYGRFLKIQQDGLPDAFKGVVNPDHPVNQALRSKFTAMLGTLNPFWTIDNNSILNADMLWGMAINLMRQTTDLSRKCWEQGIIPDWSF